MNRAIRFQLICLASLAILCATVSAVNAGLNVYDKDGVSLKLSGRIQPTFEWREKDNQQADASDTHDSYDFFVRRSRFQVEASFTNTPFPIYGKMEWKLDNWLQENSDGSKKDPSVRLENAFVRFDPWKGQFRIEFGLEDSVFSREGRQSDSTTLFVNESFIQEHIASQAMSDNATGLHLKGKALDRRLNIGIGIYEGEQQGTDLEGNSDDSLQYAAALAYHILDVEGGIAGSHVGDGKNYLTVGGYYATQSDRSSDKTISTSDMFDDKAYGFDVFGQLSLAEAGTITGHGGYFILKRDFDSGTAKKDEDRDGWYVEGAYLMPQKVGAGELELAARYQKFTPDNGADQVQTTLGVNYYIKKHDIKVLANYDFNNDDTKTTANEGVRTYDPGDTAALRVQLMF